MNQYIICIPDTHDSHDFLAAAQKYSLPLILLVKNKWIESIKSFPWDYLVVEDLNQKELIKKKLQDFLFRKYPNSLICNCIAFGEANIELIGYLNTSFKTNGLNDKQAVLFRDKYLMKLKARSLGISVPLFSSSHERANLYEALEKRSTPFKILIKPKKAWGCRGIKTFASPEESNRYIETLDRPEDYILEEYLDADMYHVGGLVNQGKTILSVVVKHGASLFEMGRSAKEHLILYTIDQHSKEAQQFKHVHDQVVEGFGLKQGLTFIEFFKDRLTGEIMLCEAAARHPALHVPKLYEIITQRNIFNAYAQILSRQLTGKSSLACIQSNHDFAGLISFAALPGRLVAVDSLDHFNRDEVVYKQQSPHLLNTIFENISFKNTIGQVMIRTRTEKECLDLLHTYCKHFNYKTISV